MPRYDVKVKVTYYYEIEADDDIEAEKQGWMYENYAYSGELQSIDISEIDEEDDEYIPDAGDLADAGLDNE